MLTISNNKVKSATVRGYKVLVGTFVPAQETETAEIYVTCNFGVYSAMYTIRYAGYAVSLQMYTKDGEKEIDALSCNRVIRKIASEYGDSHYDLVFLPEYEEVLIED